MNNSNYVIAHLNTYLIGSQYLISGTRKHSNHNNFGKKISKLFQQTFLYSEYANRCLTEIANRMVQLGDILHLAFQLMSFRENIVG